MSVRIAPLVGARSALAALALAAVAAGSLGCLSMLGLQTTPPRIYVLSATGSSADEVAPAPSASVGVLPVAIPAYLDRAAVVTQAGDGQLHLAERDLWAEGIDRGTARVLAQNLTGLRPDRTFETFPWRRAQRFDAQIALVLERFDGPLGGDVELAARWTVYGEDGKTIVAARRARFREASGTASYDAMVVAMSRALARLSQAVAESLPR